MRFPTRCRASRPPSAPTESSTENAFRDRQVVRHPRASGNLGPMVRHQPPVQARGKLWTPAFAGVTITENFGGYSMSEFTLPANSKVSEGKHWALPRPAQHVKSFRLYRWGPAKHPHPTNAPCRLDRDPCGPMVLDALVKINDQIAPTLAYRRSCREGVCGSCAMNIDGHNTLACLTPIDSLKAGTSRITPLPHLPVLKDLIPDLTGLYAQYALIEPWLQSDQPPPDRERRQSPEDRAKLDGMWECILCFCCSTSFPRHWWYREKDHRTRVCLALLLS